MSELAHIIENAFEIRHTLTPETASQTLREGVLAVLKGLDEGSYRVAEKIDGHWQVHEWVKKAMLLSFKIFQNESIHAGAFQFYDKIPLKFSKYTDESWKTSGIRAVPHAMVRYGAFIGKNTVLMPSYVNIGAYVDEGTMVDTWATVGSSAQIGKHVHLSGGVGIGGVLEPLQASPTIIEDHCFIGARSEIVEGVIIESHSVISMGVFIGQSTKIYHRMTGEITYGRVPKGSVVVPGTLPDKSRNCALSCAVIVKQVDEKTRAKTSINELLRDDGK